MPHQGENRLGRSLGRGRRGFSEGGPGIPGSAGGRFPAPTFLSSGRTTGRIFSPFVGS